MIKQFLFHSLFAIAVVVLVPLNGIGQQKIGSNISYGIPTRGGSGGKVIKVTSLNADGPGSLLEAIQTKGPRIVVFEVAGIINLNKGSLTIRNPFLTIAGQTAPSPGITIIKGSLNVKANDVIIQHIRIRPGDAGEAKKSGWEPDGLTTVGGEAYNIIVDHCSMTWAVDENLSASGPRTGGPDSTSHKITFSNNIIAEGLFEASHSKGVHSMGGLIHDFVQDIAIVGNLYSCNNQRNAFFKAFTRGAFVNNVIYNPGNFAIQMFWSQKEFANSRYTPENGQISIVGNVMFKGTNSKANLAMISRQGDVYLQDNAAYEADGSKAPLMSGDIKILTEKPSWPGGLVAIPSKDVPGYIARHAGARPADRDKIDRRIIADFVNRKGQLINSQDQVGGYPNVSPTYRKLDVPKEHVEDWLQDFADKVE